MTDAARLAEIRERVSVEHNFRGFAEHWISHRDDLRFLLAALARAQEALGEAERALESVTLALGPKVLFCEDCLECKRCRGGIYHEAGHALEVAASALAKVRGQEGT
jgi:hypothetical protein